MKKRIILFLLVFAMILSLPVFAFAKRPTETEIFYANKTSSAPALDGKVDGCYNQIFDMHGYDMLKEGVDVTTALSGDYYDNAPIGWNSKINRYDIAEHPSQKESDWYNLHAVGYAAWDEKYLYVLVEVENGGKLDANPNCVWFGDCFQFSVYNKKGTVAYIFAKSSADSTTLNATNGVSIGLTTIQKKNSAYGAAKTVSGGVFGEGPSYTYEIALEWGALGISNPNDVENFGFNVSVNLNDANMVEKNFCGMQISQGIYNETDLTTKPGMAFANKMVLKGSSYEGSFENPDTPVSSEKPENPEKPEVSIDANDKSRLDGIENVVKEAENGGNWSEEDLKAIKDAYLDLENLTKIQGYTASAFDEKVNAFYSVYDELSKKYETGKPIETTESENKGGFPIWAIILIIVAVLAAGGISVFFVIKNKKKKQ